MNTIEQQIYDRQVYLNRLKEKQRVDASGRVHNQQEKIIQEKIHEHQRLDKDKGRHVDVRA